MIVKGNSGGNVRGFSKYTCLNGGIRRSLRRDTFFGAMGQSAEAAAVTAADAASSKPWHPIALGVTSGVIVYVLTRIFDRVVPRS